MRLLQANPIDLLISIVKPDGKSLAQAPLEREVAEKRLIFLVKV